MLVRKPSSLFSDSTSSSTASSYDAPSVFSKAETDSASDSSSMSAGGSPSRRPLSVAIPDAIHGPYCPRRPNLREILANTAPAPWTLAAFMAYLSNNHCLETLEFTMDAGRYKKHYAKMMSRASDNTPPPAKDREYVQGLWERLVDAYIRPSGSREVNLPSNVRDPLLNLPEEDLPPAPETLDPAVAKIYELMEESVLVPFLNSVYPQSPEPAVSSMPSASQEYIPQSASYEDRSHYIRRSRQSRHSPPPQTAVEPYAHSYSPPAISSRRSAPAPITTGSSKNRFSSRLTQTTSSPATAGGASASIDAAAFGSGEYLPGAGMTDDSTSTDSPFNDSPVTPPGSAPTSSDGHSPKRDSGMWKKLGRLSGMKTTKKRSQGGLRERDEQ